MPATSRAFLARLRPAIALLALLFPWFAFAGVENSHHDMNKITGQLERGICSYCHLPHGARSERGLFAREGDTDQVLGAIGSFCYSCHDGTVVPTAIIQAPDGSMGLDALTKSHGYLIPNIANVTGGLETPVNVYASGLVDERDLTTNLPIEKLTCLSCHNVHSDANPPFLRAPLESLCQKCHSGSNKLGMGRWRSDPGSPPQRQGHSIGVSLTANLVSNARMSFHEPDRLFQFPTPTTEELLSLDTHWDLGGHLLGPSNNVGCPTCHSSHMPSKDLLVAAASPDMESTLCSGCHTDGVNLKNPGMTPYYHPVFEESTPPYVHEHSTHDKASPYHGDGYIELFVGIPAEFPITKTGTLTCRSCHVLHNAKTDSQCIRIGPADKPLICHECHRQGTEAVVRPDMHHPIGDRDYTAYGFPAETPWSMGKNLPGDLTDGLQCTDCHVELAKSAHNWD